MSMPALPEINPDMTLEQALNMVIVSVAMEELGLSHIINAEGEKLQYVLGTLTSNDGHKATVEEILSVNKSIKCLMDSIMQNQMLLKSKLECAVCALDSHICRPTGPTGAFILGNRPACKNAVMLNRV